MLFKIQIPIRNMCLDIVLNIIYYSKPGTGFIMQCLQDLM